MQGKRVSRTPSVTDSAGQPSNGMGSPSKIRNTVRGHQSTAVRAIDGSPAVAAASPSVGVRMPRCVEMVIRLCDEKRKGQAAAAGSYSFSEQDITNVESMVNEYKQMRAKFQTSHKEATQTNVLVQKKQQELEKMIKKYNDTTEKLKISQAQVSEIAPGAGSNKRKEPSKPASRSAGMELDNRSEDRSLAQRRKTDDAIPYNRVGMVHSDRRHQVPGASAAANVPSRFVQPAVAIVSIATGSQIKNSFNPNVQYPANHCLGATGVSGVWADASNEEILSIITKQLFEAKLCHAHDAGSTMPMMVFKLNQQPPYQFKVVFPSAMAAFKILHEHFQNPGVGIKLRAWVNRGNETVSAHCQANEVDSEVAAALALPLSIRLLGGATRILMTVPSAPAVDYSVGGYYVYYPGPPNPALPLSGYFHTHPVSRTPGPTHPGLYPLGPPRTDSGPYQFASFNPAPTGFSNETHLAYPRPHQL